MGPLEKIIFYSLCLISSLFVWWMIYQLFKSRDFFTALAVIAVAGFMLAIFYHSKED